MKKLYLLFLKAVDRYYYCPLAYGRLWLGSTWNGIVSFTKRDRCVIEKKYEGQKILLLALFEKGVLRKDIVHLLSTAKKQGLYTLCVNTKRLKNSDRYFDLFDCYIERYNFGRDFGSYKAAFRYFYKHKLDKRCSRLLMLNDSVFYSSRNLCQFIRDLAGTDLEVLGATENHEIEHHLGSFCISFSQNILQHRRLKKYWRRYRNTDIRPAVIKHGEMGLSKILRYCVSSPDNFGALYNLPQVCDQMSQSPDLLNHIFDLYRQEAMYRSSEFVDWKRPSLQGVYKRLFKKYIVGDPRMTTFEGAVNVEVKELSDLFFVDDLESLEKYVESALKNKNEGTYAVRVMNEVKYDLLECFIAGSQIHQNAIILLYLGMPIIKLDGLYRGMFSPEDVEKLVSHLPSDQRKPFRNLLYSKPFGGDVLFSWKRAAFYRGLI